ncbi:MAG TPA: hypothetical protein VF960_02525 [Chloroflexota bacterium]
MTVAKEASEPPLLDLLSQAVAHGRPEQLGRLILKTDPQFDRLTADEAEEAVRDSLGLGKRYAEELVSQQGTRDPYAIAAGLGIQVEVSNDTARYGNILQYAEYRSRPVRVRLYAKSLQGVNQLLADPGVRELLGISDATPAFLAHELFHHVDSLPDRVPAKRLRQIVTAKIGPWSVRSGLISAPEIAAGSFAQELLSMPFHLKLLDLLAIYSEKPARAANWVQILSKA